jgi:hypothetical protein
MSLKYKCGNVSHEVWSNDTDDTVLVTVEVECDCPKAQTGPAGPSVFLHTPGAKTAKEDDKVKHLPEGGGSVTFKAKPNQAIAVNCNGTDDGKKDCVVTITVLASK